MIFPSNCNCKVWHFPWPVLGWCFSFVCQLPLPFLHMIVMCKLHQKTSWKYAVFQNLWNTWSTAPFCGLNNFSIILKLNFVRIRTYFVYTLLLHLFTIYLTVLISQTMTMERRQTSRKAIHGSVSMNQL